MTILYRFLLTILIVCCHVTENLSFVSVLNSNNNKRQRNQQNKHHSTVLFLSVEGGSASACAARERQLVNYLESLTNNDDINNGDRLPCGLECTENERQQVSNMVTNLLLLQHQSNNSDNNKANNVKIADILGEWNLLYTSSRTMMINKSLSGLGRSESDKAKVGRIRQKLSGTKYLGFVEYTEQIGSGPDAFDVVISGEWAMEPVTDPFTGAPNTAIRLDLEKVMYGPSTNQADTWASLGPIKLLDIVYLTKELQICRGNINTESIFVFQRIK